MHALTPKMCCILSTGPVLITWTCHLLIEPHIVILVELAMIMDRLYGGVCYAGIDTDPELKYPKGAGRVAFSNQQSYIAAISARFVQLQHGEIDKRVSPSDVSSFLFSPSNVHQIFICPCPTYANAHVFRFIAPSLTHFLFVSSPLSGGSEAICSGRPAVWWVPGHPLWGKVCSFLLRQRDLSAVLLWVLLGSHPLSGRSRVPQAPGEGGRGPTTAHLLPVELRREGKGGRDAGSGRDWEKGVVRLGVRAMTWKMNALFF